jgi:hypothetical protein
MLVWNANVSILLFQVRHVLMKTNFVLCCCSYGYGKDNTYTYIEEARKNLDQASKSLSSSAGDRADSVSRKTGETVEGAEQTIGGYAGAAKDKAVGAWDATKQKAGELAGTALGRRWTPPSRKLGI